MLLNGIVKVLINDEYENIELSLEVRSRNESYRIMSERRLVVPYCVSCSYGYCC